MVRVSVVFEAIGPNQVQVVEELLLRLVMKTPESFGHGAEIHGVFDNSAVVGGLLLVDLVKEVCRVLGLTL